MEAPLFHNSSEMELKTVLLCEGMILEALAFFFAYRFSIFFTRFPTNTSSSSSQSRLRRLRWQLRSDRG